MDTQRIELLFADLKDKCGGEFAWNSSAVRAAADGTRGEWLECFNRQIFGRQPKSTQMALCLFNDNDIDRYYVCQHVMVKYKRAFQFSGLLYSSRGSVTKYHSHVPSTIEKVNGMLTNNSFVRLESHQFGKFSAYQFEMLGVINENIPF
jgi:hypothetical protein